jgi:hypothetical protein
VAVLVLGMMLVVAGGCAGTAAPVRQGLGAPPGARWEAVVLPEQTAAELGDVEYGWWEGRRDGAMAYREDGPLLAAGQWPEPARPTLDRPRYLSIPKQADTHLYFRRE